VFLSSNADLDVGPTVAVDYPSADHLASREVEMSMEK